MLDIQSLLIFVFGALFGTGVVWKFFSMQRENRKLQIEIAKINGEIRQRISDLMSGLKERRNLYADIRDHKTDLDSATRHNTLLTLQTEIDLIYDDIISEEKLLAKIEKRKPRNIFKQHGGRPAPAGPVYFVEDKDCKD